MKRVSRVAAFLFGVGLVVVTALCYQPLSPSAAGMIANSPHLPPAIAPMRWLPWATSTTTLPFAPPLTIGKLSEAETRNYTKQFDLTVKGMQRLNGVFTLYRDRRKGKLYAEIKAGQFNTHYLCTVTLESGLGERGLYSGLPLADYVFNFRRTENKIQFVVPNVYFRTLPDDPLRHSVQRSFSSSVLQTLTIQAYHPTRKSYLIDLGPLFLSDFPGLETLLKTFLDSSYALDANKSHFGLVKAFPLNVELESIYGFSSEEDPPPAFLEALPDQRSFNLRVRYSLSQLPQNNGYRPRLADERVGYFITAYQNFSDDSPRIPFVRYINRWHLEKQDPTAPLSPPKEPIVFWIENTVPLEYREAVRDGVLMWNRAFEQAGFKGAVQVKQMPQKADWDPADVRYNTIRWFTAFDEGFLGMGPARVNPLTGEILDADILIDANFARYMKQQYQSLVQKRMRAMSSLATLTGNPELCSYGMASYEWMQADQATGRSPLPEAPKNQRLSLKLLGNYDFCFGIEATHQLAIGAMSLAMLHHLSPTGAEMKQYVQAYLRLLIAHEVGHTLGLRHNFRASGMLSPTALNDLEITQRKGLVASVMDYSAVNLAPVGTSQGDYFTQRVGPYDEWAIAYGYTPAEQTSQSTNRILEEILRRSSEPELAYATDEDAVARLDPLINRFDMSSDLLTYAPWQLENARQLWQRLEQNDPAPGESFSDLRSMFDEVFNYYFQYARFLTAYIGGQSFTRSQRGDRTGKLPFEPVPVEQQRQALALLQKYVFDDRIFHFSPTFLNKLAPSRWDHWGETPEMLSLDYPIHDRILLLQSAMLNELLRYQRLARLRDAELRTQAPEVLTIPELFTSLQTAIWHEVLNPQKNLTLSSLRRGLQRQYLEAMGRMVLRTSNVPDDARTLAWYNLRQLRSALDDALRHSGKLDGYTRAHLEESRDRVNKILGAQLPTQ